MPKIEIPHAEQGVVRVFAVSQPIPEITRRIQEKSKPDVAASLLDHPVDEKDIELFPMSDLAGMGLASYLMEGYAIEAETLKDDRARLDQLDGYVLLLHSSVARDAAQTLTPTSDLTLIGTYAEPQPNRPSEPLTSEAAKPQEAAGPAPAKSKAGSVVGVVAVIAVLLILWLLLT